MPRPFPLAAKNERTDAAIKGLAIQYHQDAAPQNGKDVSGKLPPTKLKDAMAAHRRAIELLSETKLTAEAMRELKELRQLLLSFPEDTGAPNNMHASTYMPYPWVDDPKFDELIGRKREFHEHRALPVPHGADAEAMWTDSCSPPDGFKLTHSQLFTRNFLSPRTPYNGLLLFHGVGVGKTCSAVTIAEQFPERRVLVLTRPALQEGFRSNIYDVKRVPRRPDGTLDFENSTQCTGTSYSDRIRDRRALTPEQFEARIARLVRARYTFMGPTQFNNLIDSFGEGDAAVQRIRARFSDTVIIVDEAHHLRGEDNRRATPALRRVLEMSDNIKLVLLTATPMFNSTVDLVPLLNLLRVNDKARPLKTRELFDVSGALTTDGERRLRTSCSGYVSYMRGENPFSFPLRLTPTINQDPLVLRESRMPTMDIKGVPIPQHERVLLAKLQVCGSPMGRHQLAAYVDVERKIVEQLAAAANKKTHDEEDDIDSNAYGSNDDESYDDGDGGDELNDDNNKKAHALHSGQQVCNLVYPVTSGLAHGQAAFNNVFRRADGRGGASRAMQLEYKPGVPQFLSPSHIVDYAPKIDAIVKRIMKSEGIVMVYSRWLYSGLVPMAIALEHAGMSRLDAPPLLVSSPPSWKKGAASIRGGSKHKRKQGIEKDKHPDIRQGIEKGRAWTYAIISGQRDVASDLSSAIEKLRSPENVDGAVVKVILMSDKGTEGLDLRYVREVHVMEPWYHLNKVEQIVGRASRHCSHAALPLTRRNVTVYLHAAVDPRPGASRETVDMRAYRIAQRKQENIRHVESVLRDSAIDCGINAPRLYYPPGSSSVNLETSQGKRVNGYHVGDTDSRLAPHCKQPLPPKWSDESTYDVHAHAHHMNTYARLLRTLFATRAKVTYQGAWEHVSSRFKEARRELMNLALDSLVHDRNEVLDARGRLGHVVYRGNAYLFQPDDVDTEFLTDAERTSAVPGGIFRRTLVLPDASPTSTPPLLSKKTDAANKPGRQIGRRRPRGAPR